MRTLLFPVVGLCFGLVLTFCGGRKPEIGVVTRDSILRSLQGAGSPKVGDVKIAEDVQILERRGDWAHVASGNIKGFLPAAAVAGPGDFTPVKDWKITEMSGCWGESCYEFQFTKEGSFKYSYNLCGSGSCEKPLSAN